MSAEVLNTHAMSSTISEFPPRARMPTVLVVDDEAIVRTCFRRILAVHGYASREASNGEEAFEIISAGGVSVVLLDLNLGEERGIDLLARLKHLSPEVAVVVVTSNVDIESAKLALCGGAHAYLTKPVRPIDLASHVLSALAQRHSTHRGRVERAEVGRRLTEAEALIETMPMQVAQRLVLVERFRHAETGSHVVRIGLYSEVMAAALRFEARRAEQLGTAATMHDIGKVAIPDSILLKPGLLTADEFRIMQTHTTIGARMLASTDIPLLALAEQIAQSHHERWDGTGYPEGRRGEETPLEARIVGVVDVFDALSTRRVYKPAWSDEQVARYFADQRGRQFDPSLVDTFIACLPRLWEVRDSTPDGAPNE